MSESSVDRPINYSGRKPERESSRRRRKAILTATLNIIVREGVRGISHRSIAAEAGVSLSAITYYFKTISVLILDAFTKFVEMSLTRSGESVDEKVIGYIEQCDSDMLHLIEGRREIISHMARMIVVHTLRESHSRRDELILEQAFMLEALRNQRFHDLLQRYYEERLVGAMAICRLFGSDQPRNDALVLQNAITEIKLDFHLIDISNVDTEAVVQRLVRLITGLFL